jgi:hypothetical protein
MATEALTPFLPVQQQPLPLVNPLIMRGGQSILDLLGIDFNLEAGQEQLQALHMLVNEPDRIRGIIGGALIEQGVIPRTVSQMVDIYMRNLFLAARGQFWNPAQFSYQLWQDLRAFGTTEGDIMRLATERVNRETVLNRGSRGYRFILSILGWLFRLPMPGPIAFIMQEILRYLSTSLETIAMFHGNLRQSLENMPNRIPGVGGIRGRFILLGRDNILMYINLLEQLMTALQFLITLFGSKEAMSIILIIIGIDYHTSQLFSFLRENGFSGVVDFLSSYLEYIPFINTIQKRVLALNYTVEIKPEDEYYDFMMKLRESVQKLGDINKNITDIVNIDLPPEIKEPLINNTTMTGVPPMRYGPETAKEYMSGYFGTEIEDVLNLGRNYQDAQYVFDRFKSMIGAEERPSPSPPPPPTPGVEKGGSHPVPPPPLGDPSGGTSTAPSPPPVRNMNKPAFEVCYVDKSGNAVYQQQAANYGGTSVPNYDYKKELRDKLTKQIVQSDKEKRKMFLDSIPDDTKARIQYEREQNMSEDIPNFNLHSMRYTGLFDPYPVYEPMIAQDDRFKFHPNQLNPYEPLYNQDTPYEPIDKYGVRRANEIAKGALRR